MLKPDQVDYHAVRSADLTSADHDRINPVLWEYLRHTFPEVDPDGLAVFYGRAAYSRGNPNLAVGSPTIRSRQMYGRSVSILAMHEGDVVAHLTVADNVSSGRHERLPQAAQDALGLGERLLKLYEPYGTLPGKDKPLIASRYMYLGQPALGPAVRASLEEAGPDEFIIVDGMLLKGAIHKGTRIVRDQRRNHRQPVSGYTYEEEGLWQDALRQAGLTAVENSQEELHPFGEDAPATTQETWRAESIGAMQARLFDKSGVETAIFHMNGLET